MAKKLVSIVTPVFNEEDAIESYYDAIKQFAEDYSDRYDFEFIITDNASTDNTFGIIEAIAEKDSRIRAFRFSKNFGQQKSMYTGYLKARGACAVEIDCDLQDPPEVIGSFLDKWEQGHDIVYGVRESRDEGRTIHWMRKLFYRFIAKLSHHDLPIDAGDFMLIDRKVLDVLVEIEDSNPYLRGIIYSLGFKRAGVPYKRHARKQGKTHYTIRQLFGVAIDGVISQSTVPLRVASYVGALVVGLIVLLSAYYVINRLFIDSEMPEGFATLVVLLLFSIGLNAIFLGIIGEYLARIYTQVKQKPLVIITREIDSAD